MSEQWFVMRGGEKQGPLSARQLKVLARDGKLALGDKVQKAGMTRFVHASAVRGLFPESHVQAALLLPTAPAPVKIPLVNFVPLPLPAVSANANLVETVLPKARSGLRRLPRFWVGGAAAAVLVILAIAIFQFVPRNASKKGGELAQTPEWQPGVAVSDHDESQLWRAAITVDYTHNRVAVPPETWSEHSKLIARYGQGNPEDWHSKMAKCIAAKDDYLVANYDLTAKAQAIYGQVPNAYKRSMVNTGIRTLLGNEPSYREILNEAVPGGGGIVTTADAMRILKVATHLSEIERYQMNGEIADKIETKYRKALGNRALVPEIGLRIGEYNQSVGVVHTGKKPLMNLVVVTRATMKSETGQGVLTRGVINAINEGFDPGADRNVMAAKYIETAAVMHASPQASFIYVPIFEPGDSLSLRLFDIGFHLDVQDVKISVYRDSGAILDQVVSTGHATEAQPKEIAAGPAFNSYPGLLEIVLKPEGKGSFERCVPFQSTYLKVGIRDEIDSVKPLEVIAKGDNDYVVVGSKKLVGRGLVLIPQDAVAKVNDLNPKVVEIEKVEFLKRQSWVVLDPPSRGSKSHSFETCSTLLDGICTKTGNTVEIEAQPNELFRVVATWDNMYVVILTKPASDGTKIILVPKSKVQDLKQK